MWNTWRLPHYTKVVGALGGHTERPASVLEKSGTRQSIASANPNSIRNDAHPTKISLRVIGSWRELESRKRGDHISVQMSEL